MARATALIRSASGWAAWCFQSLTQACGEARNSGRLAERRAVRLDRQHRAGGEVDADADDVRGIDAALAEHGRDGLPEDLEVVVGVLERPIRREPHLAIGERQPRIDHPVGVRMDRGRDLPAVGHVDQDGASRFGSKVDADRVRGHVALAPADPIGSDPCIRMRPWLARSIPVQRKRTSREGPGVLGDGRTGRGPAG